MHATLEQATHCIPTSAHVLADELHRAAVEVLQFHGGPLILTQLAKRGRQLLHLLVAKCAFAGRGVVGCKHLFQVP